MIPRARNIVTRNVVIDNCWRECSEWFNRSQQRIRFAQKVLSN